MNIARHNQAGFTLIEMMVVLVVLGLAIGIAVPSFQRSMDRARTDGAATELQSDLKLAISTARATGRTLRVDFSAGGYKLTDAADSTRVFRSRDIAAGVRMSSSGDVLVFPWGQVQAASIEIAGSSIHRSLLVLPTGRVECVEGEVTP